MERESFEDEQVAKILNKDFISIKVDREERPDIDAIYMSVCQAFTSQGGWPLTILMTPDQKPFFAGTYFPKEDRYGGAGLLSLLRAVQREWKQNRKRLIDSAEEIVLLVSKENQEEYRNTPKSIIEDAVRQLQKGFDSQYGGWNRAPKFPTPHNLLFLLRQAKQKNDKQLLSMVETTLSKMYQGGIFDHVGFGFCRYSTDRKWLVPHFEKMLYDNALLLLAYLEAYQLTKRPLYREVSEKIMIYLMRELKSKEGGFYSAEDADVGDAEGEYYLFTKQEILSLLGEENGWKLCEYFGITVNGNFEGKNILNRIDREDPQEKDETMEALLQKLLAYRKTRMTLHKDDKILTSWNALVIVAFSKAYEILREDTYRKSAEDCIRFIEENLIDEDGRLLIRYREGESAGKGVIDDYSFLVWAYLSLYRMNYNVSYLKKAATFGKKMIQLFFDQKKGGFYLYGSDAEQLIFRPKEVYDGATPSGNSVAAYVLLLLDHLTADEEFFKTARKQIDFLLTKASEFPAGHCFSMMAIELFSERSIQVVCVVENEDEVEKISKLKGSYFLPGMTMLIKRGDELDEIAPFTKGYHSIKNQSSFYIFEGQTCSAPFCSFEKLREYFDRETAFRR